MKIARIVKDKKIPIPQQKTAGAAGYDLSSTVHATLKPGERKLISTGFAWEIPINQVGFIKPRSGLAVKHGLDVMAGVIDSDYRGEVKVLLINHSNSTHMINIGDRIAQMVVLLHYSGPLTEVDTLHDTKRGCDGFGSTGDTLKK